MSGCRHLYPYAIDRQVVGFFFFSLKKTQNFDLVQFYQGEYSNLKIIDIAYAYVSGFFPPNICIIFV